MFRKHAYWSGVNTGDSIFDNIRLDEKRQQLEHDFGTGTMSYYKFNLEFEVSPDIDELKKQYNFNEVRIRKNLLTLADLKAKKTGKYIWYHPEWTPRDWLNKHVNKFAINPKTGRPKPLDSCPFVASFDPVNYRMKKDVVVGSSDALYVFLMPNPELNSMIGENISNDRPFVEYLFRNDKPSDTIFDVIKTIFYFGCYILIETNMPYVATKMIEWGLGEFLLVLNDKGAIEPYRYGSDTQRLFSTQSTQEVNNVGDYVLVAKQQLAEPETDLDMDNVKYLDSRDIIDQLIRFRPEKTKEYDAAMSYMIGLIACRSLRGWRQKQTTKSATSTTTDVMKALMGICH